MIEENKVIDTKEEIPNQYYLSYDHKVYFAGYRTAGTFCINSSNVNVIAVFFNNYLNGLR